MIRIKNVKIYQIATDCVFSGTVGNYNEMAKHDALDVYGKTKSLGEVNIKNFFNIRVSIIGKELDTKNSLVEWFLSNEKKEKILFNAKFFVLACGGIENASLLLNSKTNVSELEKNQNTNTQ